MLGVALVFVALVDMAVSEVLCSLLRHCQRGECNFQTHPSSLELLFFTVDAIKVDNVAKLTLRGLRLALCAAAGPATFVHAADRAVDVLGASLPVPDSTVLPPNGIQPLRLARAS